MADDICSNCNHSDHAHAYADESGVKHTPEVVSAEDFDESSAVRGPCQHDGCDCTQFVAGGETVSSSRDADAANQG
jgi:hypothetical protein